MAKYRILKVSCSDETYFILQKKSLLFWTTIQEINCYPIGGYSYEMKFKSIEEAEMYYMDQIKKQIFTIVKHLE